MLRCRVRIHARELFCVLSSIYLFICVFVPNLLGLRCVSMALRKVFYFKLIVFFNLHMPLAMSLLCCLWCLLQIFMLRFHPGTIVLSFVICFLSLSVSTMPKSDKKLARDFQRSAQHYSAVLPTKAELQLQVQSLQEEVRQLEMVAREATWLRARLDELLAVEAARAAVPPKVLWDQMTQTDLPEPSRQVDSSCQTEFCHICKQMQSIPRCASRPRADLVKVPRCA